MSLNKYAAYRYRVIDSVLTSQSKVSFRELKMKINERLRDEYGKTDGISDRTLYSDINIMRSEPPRGYNAPIQCQNGLYFYSVKGFSIHNEPLSEEDVNSIREALDLLKQFGSLPLIDQLSQIIEETGISKLQQCGNETIVLFDTNPALKGLEKIGILYDAIRKNQEVEIIYHPFKNQSSQTYRCQPYLLKEYRNRWYLICRVVEIGMIFNLALDRMISINPTGRSFQKKDLQEVVQRFENVIGVTVPDNLSISKVILKVNNESLHYILTKPLHQSQTLIEKKESYSLISLDVIPNFELESNLLSFGDNIVVLEPAYLKATLKKRIQCMVNNYK